MDKLIVTGPCKLAGPVEISSSKNASLPILAATLLFPQEIKFNHLPELSDIIFFTKILESLGAKAEIKNQTKINTSSVKNTHADYELVRKMRASVLVLGPLLSRFKQAEVSLPGGCAIGSRPVDIHLSGLEALGAEIKISSGYIRAKTNGLIGTTINMQFPSVGATENLMMAAVWAQGETIIKNAAKEPEIEDLAKFLIQFGTKVSGAGTDTITIEGRKLTDFVPTQNNEYRIIGDRIEAATFIIAGLITNSEIEVTNFKPTHLTAVLDTLKKMGAKLEVSNTSVKIFPSGRLKPASIDTAPYPGFPTDVQAQLMTLMGIASGKSTVSEHIFENRFMHVPELNRMGMKIELDGRTANITGTSALSPAPVMCTDLRASASLVLAALATTGETHINRIYHLDRGYEKLENKLQKLGAKIVRAKS